MAISKHCLCSLLHFRRKDFANKKNILDAFSWDFLYCVKLNRVLRIKNHEGYRTVFFRTENIDCCCFKSDLILLTLLDSLARAESMSMTITTFPKPIEYRSKLYVHCTIALFELLILSKGHKKLNLPIAFRLRAIICEWKLSLQRAGLTSQWAEFVSMRNFSLPVSQSLYKI